MRYIINQAGRGRWVVSGPFGNGSNPVTAVHKRPDHFESLTEARGCVKAETGLSALPLADTVEGQLVYELPDPAA